MIKQIPDGAECYTTRIFSESTVCPDLDDSITREPKCRKYNEPLTWTRSGKVLKCKKCLEDEDQRVKV